MPKIASICVFCGSSPGIDTRHTENAAAFGRMMAERQVSLVFGGGRVGLMGTIADSVMAHSGCAVGVIPEHLDEIEVGHTGLTELIRCKSMHERKVEMFRRADAFVTLPGGLGSLDEAFEAMTLRQLGVHDKPLVFFNALGFWDTLLATIDGIIEEGFAKPGHRALFTVANTLEEIFDQLEAEHPPRFDPREKLV